MATILVSNPGSASRKYALFDGDVCKLRLHFEHESGQIVCTISNETQGKQAVIIDDLSRAARTLPDILQEHGFGEPDGIALRIVAPSSYFLQHRHLDNEARDRLHALESRAPLHIKASLQELDVLQSRWPDKPVLGISDSAFHATKPDWAWNYGIRLEDADAHEIKRFGYHGLSAQSVVRQLGGHLPPKVVICHLGSGNSVMAVHQGVGRDATMGFSPLEGLLMSTRSGTFDVTAARALQDALHMDDAVLNTYLNSASGLLGISGASGDVRVLLEREADGEYRANLALNMYVYRVQQAIGQMAATLGGVDGLVFTGTVGERAPIIRRRIVSGLRFLEFELDHEKNGACTAPSDDPQPIQALRRKPVLVVPAQEEREMALAANSLLGSGA